MAVTDVKEEDLDLLRAELPELRALLARSESSALQHTVAITLGLLILVWVLSDMVVVAGMGGFWKVPLIMLWFLAAMWMMRDGMALIRERFLSKKVEEVASKLHQETLQEIHWDAAGMSYRDKLTQMINLPAQAAEVFEVYQSFMHLSGRWESLAATLSSKGIMDEAAARTFLTHLRELMAAEAKLAAVLS